MPTAPGLGHHGASAAAGGVSGAAGARLYASRLTPEPTRLRLSAAQLAGQRVIYAYGGLRPPGLLLSLIRRGEAAGVILFGANVRSPAQLRAAVGRLQRAARRSPVDRRLLVLVDQEGGEVRRLAGGPQLSELQIGLRAPARRLALARDAGWGAARALRAAGADLNLAPVLGVYRELSGFLARDGRSYSDRASVVAALGARFIWAQQSRGVAATAKHFPGLGAAGESANTDLRPVTLGISLRELRRVDEAPFRAAIRAGVKLVMSSWAVYPALDRRWPAGLSPVVLQRELRGRLGFRGVTITDAIGAGALRRYGSIAARSVAAARAGEDLILATGVRDARDPTAVGVTVLHALTGAIRSGRLPLGSAQAAADRVLALRTDP